MEMDMMKSTRKGKIRGEEFRRKRKMDELGESNERVKRENQKEVWRRKERKREILKREEMRNLRRLFYGEEGEMGEKSRGIR